MKKAFFHLGLFILFVFSIYTKVYSQQSCPPNIDFEYGNLNNWKFYTGSCCPINATALGIVAGRHTLTSGSVNDPYGNFPVVGAGYYSLKLGNNSTGAQAERARYYVKVPNGVSNYAFIYKYAIVLEDPKHAPAAQPRFEVKVLDSLTNNVITVCNNRLYVSSGSLPGFTASSINSQVYYLPWTTAMLDLSGLSGRTVAVDFSSGDCALGGHFGYGYVDLSCGLFQINQVACNQNNITLSAPPGYQSYEWRDSTLINLLGTGATITLPTPGVTSVYNVILKPYPGVGCPDTLATKVLVSSLSVDVMNDTLVCKNSPVSLRSNVTNGIGNLTYSWSPSTGLSCNSCIMPSATISNTTKYYLSVLDSSNCVKIDSVTLYVAPQFNVVKNDALCFATNTGTATVSPLSGYPPYVYSWSTTPVQTTITSTGLSSGTYSVTVTDSKGCTDAQMVTIGQPSQLTSSTTQTSVKCNGGSDGSASVTASGGTPPYTYSWNTSPAKTTSTASGLSAGTYTCTVTDSKGCTSSSTVAITQPQALYQVTSFGVSVSCYGGSNGSSTIQVGGGTAPYSYSWNTTPIQTSNTATGLSAGVYTMTVTDANGCVSSYFTNVTQPPMLLGQIGMQNNVSCNGGSNGSVSILASGGTPPYSYSWNTTPIQTSSTATGLRAGTYIGTVTDSKGCTALVNAIITEPARLISTIADSINILCNGDSTGKAAVIASGGIKPYSYSWNTVPLQTSDTGKRLKAGVTIVTVTDGNGCISRSSVTLTQPTAVIVSDSVKDVSCYNGNDGMIQVYATGGMLPYTYSWNAFPLLKDSIARNLKKGTYVMSVSDSNGCRKTLSIDVNQPQDISMNFTIEDTSCMYEGKGRATVHAKGGTSPYRFSWNTMPTQYDSSSYALLPKYYTATVIDAHNCVKKDSVLIPGYPDVVTKVTADTMMCQGDTITLHITGASFYTWNPNLYINKWYLSSPKVYPDTSIRYVIYAQDSNGCRDTNYVKVTVIYKNKLYVSDSQQICEGGSVQLRAYGGTDYTWQPSESLDDSHKSDPFASPSQTTVYRVKINQDNCFSEELEEKVLVNKNPVLNLQEEIKAFPGARIPLDPHAQYAVKYEWTPVTGLSCTDCETPTLEVGTTTQYILKATGEGDCSTYDTVTIHSMCDGSVLYMANTFTPNGDGNNDYFYPQGTGVGVIKSFRVMNHWGQVVFEARDIPGNQSGYGWNGKYKGADLPGDVFAYMVEYECSDGQIGSVTGDITLIR